MSSQTTVKVSRRFQIVVPLEARERLKIKGGDRLLVDVQGDTLVLLPEPRDYAEHLEGLHREVWAGVDTAEYLRAERDAWRGSRND